MPASVSMREAKASFSNLIARVEAGEEIVVTRAGRAVARLVPVPPPKGKRVFGAMRGRVGLDDSFFDPLPEDELRLWNGEGD